MKIYEIIQELSKEYSIYQICKALNISQSSYSYWNTRGRKNEEDKIKLCQKIIAIYRKYNGIYGAPKIFQELKKENIECSLPTVSRIMRYLGLKSIVISRFPRRRNKLTIDEQKNIINLIKGIEITSINQVWTTDITYIKTHRGMYYMISFIDYFSKKVIAWGLFYKQRTEQVLEVLENAIKIRNPLPGLIIHSDKGSQMRSRMYRRYLASHNIAFSYTSIDHSCDENAAQESFHALLKKERLYQSVPKNFEEAQNMIRDYINNFYNSVRTHSSLNYNSPEDFEKKLLNPIKTTSNY